MKKKEFRCKRRTILLLCFAMFITAIATTARGQTPTPEIETSSSYSANADSEKIAVLRAQLELMRQYDQRLLATVYWSLGALAAVVVLVIGLGWYTNFRVYRGELDTKVTEAVHSIEGKLRSEAQRSVENAVSKALRDIRKIQLDMLLRKAKEWEEEGVYGNALAEYAEMIGFGPELPAYRMGQTLDAVLRIMKREKTELDAHDAAVINENLDLVPAHFRADVDAIRALIAASKTKQG